MQISVLSGDARRFAALTFPAYAGRLTSLERPVVAIGAETVNGPAGLALAWRENDAADVLSVSVRRDLRRQGVGSALILALERELVEQGVRRASARFADTLEQYGSLLHLIDRAGWSAPEPYSVQVTGRAGHMAAKGGAWIGVAGRLKAPREVTYPPLQLNASDNAAIEMLMAQAGWGTHADPRRYVETMDQVCSVAMRHGDRLVGWVIGEQPRERLGPGTTDPEAQSIYYPENYLDETLWSAGLSIGAYFHAFSRQAEHYGPRSLAIYRTHPGRPRMIALTRRRFAPIAERVDTMMITHKMIGGSS